MSINTANTEAAETKSREIIKYFEDNSCYKTHYRTTAFNTLKYIEFSKVLGLPAELISQTPITPFTIDADLYYKALAHFTLFWNKFNMGGPRPENIPADLINLIVEFIPRETAEYIEINSEMVQCKLCTINEPCNIKLGWWGWQAHIKTNLHKIHVARSKTQAQKYKQFMNIFESINYLNVFNRPKICEKRYKWSAI
jgi:hypothetical protein